MVSNIQKLIDLISTSEAIYSKFNLTNLLQNLTSKDGGFTDIEAEDFVSRYEIAAPFETKLSGFQAILFHDKIDNKFVFAVRGSEQAIEDFTFADGGDIGRFGFAAGQAADMYRYWKKLTTPLGQQVTYSTQEQLQLYVLTNPSAAITQLPLAINGLMSLLSVFSLTTEYNDFVNSLHYDAGLGAISPEAKVDVSGHSLGGNLASVFASMFPNNVEDVVTINAPSINGGLGNINGFGITGQDLLQLLGFSAVNQSKVTSVTAEGDLVHLASGSQIGSIVNITQEVGHGIVDGVNNNHSVINGLDSLNLMALFAKLDVSQASRPAGILKDIMQASSNITIDTYENMLDALRYMLEGASIEKTDQGLKGDLDKRNSLYNNMAELMALPIFKTLSGKVAIVQVSTDSQKGKTDYGQFLALYYLAPFAIECSESLLRSLNSNLYDLWLADKNLSATDKLAGKQNFSDTWYTDRAKFVERLLSRNTDDTEIDHKNPHREVIYFNDIKSGTQLTSVPELVFNGRFSTDQVPTTNAFFGGDENNLFTGNRNQDHFYGGAGNDTLKGEAGFDYLEGNAGNDLLYGGDDADHLLGGAGDDQLVGEGGNDILEGGQGNDTYAFTGTFGHDIIKDSDGIGSIIISGITLSTLTQSAPDSNTYYDNLTNPTKRAVLIDEGDTKSLIISTVTQSGKNIITSGNSVTIKNWSIGNLSISLQMTTATNTADSRTINGTAGDNAITLENLKDTNGSYTAGVTALYANGGAGRDIIMGSLSTDDILLGDDNDDIISGGFIDNLSDPDYAGKLLPTAAVAGKDWIDGGKGNDNIFASIGGGAAHGGDDNDVLSSDSGAYFLFNKQDAAALDPAKYNVHAALKRDDIWGDIVAQRLSFGVTKGNNNVYSYDISIAKDLTNNFAEYTGSITGAHYIGKRGSTSSSYNSGGFGLNYSTSQTYAYDYNKENSSYSPVDNANHTNPVNFAMSGFSLAAGHTYAEYASQPGGNLFGDKGNDTLFGGMFADNLSGGDNDDVIFGGEGHDIIDGGTGIDTVYGGDGNDLISGGDGDDILSGSVPADVLAAGVGDNDTIFGGKGIDYIAGGKGSDYLDGGIDGDVIFGNEGDDYLFAGDDTEKDQLMGGIGNDTMVLYRNDVADGEAGNNIYIYNTHQVTTAPLPVVPLAAPQVVVQNINTNNNAYLASILNSNVTVAAASIVDTTFIFNTEGQNTLALAGVSSLDGFEVELVDDQLQISDGSQLLVIGAAATAAPVQLVFGNSVEQLAATPFTYEPITDEHFLNGIAPLEQAQLNTADVILANHMGVVTLSGTVANQYLAGGLINDTLTANSQGTRFIGGRGDDALLGGVGDDTYLIRKDDGADTIVEKGGQNRIKFDKNIALGDVVVRRSGADLLLSLPDDQSITVKNMFDANTGALIVANGITNVNFYTGELWNVDKLKVQSLVSTNGNDAISGFDSADVLAGGKGDDQLAGASGNDSYDYALGDGSDTICDSAGTDTLRLGAGITQAQVMARRDTLNNLLISFADGGKITIANAFDASGNFTTNAIETISFSDSSSWNLSQIKTEVLKNQSQMISGSLSDETLSGDAGNNTLIGNKGNDSLLGGAGDDVYQYALGDGNDVITDLNGADTIQLGAGITESNVMALSDGKDLILRMSDGATLQVKDMFVSKTPNTVDPVILSLLDKLQTRWISQAEALIEKDFGMVGSGDLEINFAHNLSNGAAAQVNFKVSPDGQSTTAVLVLNLDVFTNGLEGVSPNYYDRTIAHEMTHAVMSRYMNVAALPGWFQEGTAELIKGGDDRVKNDLKQINTQQQMAA